MDFDPYPKVDVRILINTHRATPDSQTVTNSVLKVCRQYRKQILA